MRIGIIWGKETLDMAKRITRAELAAREAKKFDGMTELEVEAEWNRLWELVDITLDEDGHKRHDKRESVAEKMLRKAGGKMPFDLQSIKKLLVVYSKASRWDVAMAASGVTQIEWHVAKNLWPKCKTAIEFIIDMRAEAFKQKKADKVEEYREQLDKLAQDDDGVCKANVKAITFGLEGMDRENFGEQKTSEGGENKKTTVNYNLPNLTVNMITAPKTETRKPIVIPVDETKAVL